MRAEQSDQEERTSDRCEDEQSTLQTSATRPTDCGRLLELYVKGRPDTEQTILTSRHRQRVAARLTVPALQTSSAVLSTATCAPDTLGTCLTRRLTAQLSAWQRETALMTSAVDRRPTRRTTVDRVMIASRTTPIQRHGNDRIRT
jgi:hypothetical protein